MTLQTAPADVLASARRKAYVRLLPVLFLCYVIAYIDRANVSLAKLRMVQDLPHFNDAIFGFGMGIFFVGYFILEIPGSIICERWSARKWICRIMVTWGIVAACTALVTTPAQFYTARFLLGLAEAGFFPGVIVFLSHWFTARDRGRALSIFFVATPIAQLVSPKISNALLKMTAGGLHGWQWLYIVWGAPAVIVGLLVLVFVTDHPRHAKWLTDDEKRTLEAELERERAMRRGNKRMSLIDAFANPNVLLLTASYFCTTSANYGFEFFLPSILQQWYGLKLDAITSLVLFPPLLALISQLFVGWNSDRTRERRLHSIIPIIIGGIALALAPLTQGHLVLTVACFTILIGGIKAYQPAFWSLPNLLLTETAAAGCIGLINSTGNLGGMLGPWVLGDVKTRLSSFVPGIYVLSGMMFLSALILLWLNLGRRDDGDASTLSQT